MNQRLIDTIKEHTPESWEYVGAADSKGLNFEIHEVTPGIEYNNVTTDLKQYEGCVKVEWIKRMQNLYMFGRYLLRHQQLMARAPESVEEIRYCNISENNIKEVATYNVDPRHLKDGDANANAEKTFLMHQDIGLAIKSILKKPEMNVLVMARITTENGDLISDAECYPEYLVCLSVTNEHQLMQM